MNQNTHQKQCEANICADDPDKGYTWYPDESVCSKRPFLPWQLKQRKIQALFQAGKLKYFGHYKLADLNAIARVTAGTKGHDAERIPAPPRPPSKTQNQKAQASGRGI